MVDSIMDFFKSETGNTIVKWALSSGLGLVILFVWITTLSRKQERLEAKVDKQEIEMRQMSRFQTDTLLKTLTVTNRILEDFKKPKR
jgi:hypothetical protein